MTAVTCPLCGQRKARRHCPALNQQICAVCCGTKRLVEIRCPADCPYLSVAKEHPPATLLRRQQQDVSVLLRAMRDLSERQSQLFLMAGAFLVGYQPPELQTLQDEDVAQAAEAMAATYETATRGLIYEHRSSSRTSEGLAAALKPLFEEARGSSGSSFDRVAAVVLGRIGETVREIRTADAGNPRAFLELLGRVIGRPSSSDPGPGEGSRLIVP